MRKLTTILLSVLLTLLFASQFLSCEKYVLPELSISPDTLWFSAAADSQVVLLVTNVITTAEPENAGWLHADPAWMDENTAVTIHVWENETTRSRSAVIPFKSESLQHNLIVMQEGKPSDPED